MPWSPARLALFAVLATVTAQVAAQPVFPRPLAGSPKPAAELGDDKALAAAKLDPADGNALRDYIKQRTLSDKDLARIQEVIRRLGSDDFAARLAAEAEVARFGPAAVAPLRKAATVDAANVKGADFEVAYRADLVLRRVETVPHAAVALAVVRSLGVRPHPDNALVLLNYLPVCDTPAVADAIRAALTAQAVRAGKADPALVAALTDAHPLKRTAAALALVEGGPAGARVRIPDAYPKVQAAVKVEADPDARFQMLFALAATAGDREAVGHLVASLAALTHGRLWQAEDYLLQLAGPTAPKATFGKSAAAKAQAQQAWVEWWAKHGATLDPGQFTYAPRTTGRLIVVVPMRSGQGGYVAELGPDLAEVWRMTNLQSPFDARIRPDGTIAVAEYDAMHISIRDSQGTRLNALRVAGDRGQRQPHQPIQVQLLPDDGMLVVCKNAVVEYTKDKAGKEAWKQVYARANNYDIASAARLPNGETAILVQNGPTYLIFVDKAGKEIAGRKPAVGPPYYQADIEPVGPDRLLVTEANQVVEYDLTDGKAKWQYQATHIRCVQRLPNGNTLLVDADRNRLVEVSPAKEEVWDYTPPAGQQLLRAYRR